MPKHNAPQKTLLPVKMAVTIVLDDDEQSHLWHAYKSAHAEMNPSTNQLAKALLVRGLTSWKTEKGL